MSNHIKSSHVLLVGTGYMAKEYVKVLKSLPCKFVVIGNQLTSTKEFERATGKKAYSGGIEKFNNFSEIDIFSFLNFLFPSFIVLLTKFFLIPFALLNVALIF